MGRPPPPRPPAGYSGAGPRSRATVQEATPSQAESGSRSIYADAAAQPLRPPPGGVPEPYINELAPGADLPQPFFLGRYRVVDEIGVGGMASVHLARFDGPGGFQKWVAIKRIHPHLVDDDQFVDMFLDEARIAAGINHANVAQVFDLGKDNDTYWIAMEYLHGEPLREIMRRVDELQIRIPFHIAAKICADAAEGLHGAHELRGRNGQLLNLVHRDVTPHNLFVTYDGYTKVVDFGIAKVVDRLASTRAGTLKGKLAYMSPEQVRGHDVDRRTDIFALGVVMWELLTGQRLFRRDTDLDTLEQVQACNVPPPTSIVADCPPELEAVVMKALSQARDERFPTAREFSRALQRLLMKLGQFVGPEDVSDFAKDLFHERVEQRERYLEWAAEVTSSHDVERMQQQRGQPQMGQPQTGQVPGAQPPPAPSLRAPEPPPAQELKPNLMRTTPAGRPAKAPSLPPPKKSAPPPPPANPHRSSGQNSAAAAVVTTPPVKRELGATALIDDDEEIPTVVAQSSYTPTPGPSAPKPAWDGGATQLIDEGQPVPSRPPGGPAPIAVSNLESTVALGEDSPLMVPPTPMPPIQPHQVQPLTPMTPSKGAPAAAPAAPLPPGQQRNVETKMSLPRPTAVAEWLAQSGQVEIEGPRSTGIIVAIAALATLCVMGVGSLIVYKLRLPARTTAPAAVPSVNPANAVARPKP